MSVRIHAPWNDLLAEPLAREHFVQLYRDDHVLAEAVALFVGVGLGKAEAAVVLATVPHVRTIEARLEGRGFDVKDLERWGQLTLVDATEMLSQVMKDDLPDPDLFKDVVGRLLESARAAGRYRKVRVYGEMVNLLWRDNLRAAIRLEALWNEVIESHSITLLCAYGLDHEASHEFHPVLRALHAHLIPVEAWA